MLNISTITGELGLPFSCLPSLGRVLEFLGIPFQKYRLHKAGNDAHFTLRVLLMFVATSLERMKLDASLIARIFDLKSIVLSLIDFDSRTPDTKKFHTGYRYQKGIETGTSYEVGRRRLVE
jgi:hypothetical protein